jgi:outer membrane protein OmpA-like peptidoglycan-associated protein
MPYRVRSNGRQPLRALRFLLVALAACASFSHSHGAAVIGASAGDVVGNDTGSTTRSAITGAIVGGAAGAIIGHQMDQLAKEIKQRVAGATVERVGEGIEMTFASALLYEADADRVRPAAAQNLRNLATTLSRYRDTDLLIVGHTDAVGSAGDNQALSERRASAVTEFLIGEGVAAGRLHSAGRGEMEPRRSNAGDNGRQANRRVEVAIYASVSYRNEVQRPANTR